MADYDKLIDLDRLRTFKTKADAEYLGSVTLSTSADTYVVPVTGGTANIDVGDGLNVSEGTNKITLSAKTGTTSTTVAAGNHTHTVAGINGLQSALDAKQATLVSGTNIKTINGTSLLGSGDLTVGGSVSMEEEDVDAAVEAAWPAPTGYAITPSQTYIQSGNLKGIGLSDKVSSGEFVSTAAEGETVYVLLSTGHWEPEVTIDSSGSTVGYNLYGPAAGGMLYTFTMPADAVTVGAWYND